MKIHRAGPTQSALNEFNNRHGFRFSLLLLRSSIVFSLLLLFALGSLAGCDGDDAVDGPVDTPDVGDPGDDVFPDEDAGDITDDCDPDELLCGTSCIDPMVDRSHCGECNNSCSSGFICVEGVCTLQCPGNLVPCGSTCVDTTSSNRHCGECDFQCEQGQSCVDGSCQFVCPTGQTACDGQCVNLDRDPENCGDCGFACSPGQVCVSGECALQCPDDMESCDNTCVSLLNDPANCGDCGIECSPDEVCSMGECRVDCHHGFVECSGRCVNIQTDRNHCGECNTGCDSGQVCSGGSCVLTCASGQTDCSGNCVNLLNDRANCGTCNAACAAGEICDGGQCLLDCPSPTSECFGVCVNTNNDRDHCGQCSNPCPQGQVCANGTCAVSCPTGQTNCDGECVNITVDSRHCGECGRSCPAGYFCVDGDCVINCPSGQIECNETCVNPMTDNNNCGECNEQCGPTASCVEGICVQPASSVTLDANRIDILQGATRELEATVHPEDATNKAVLWESGNSAVATVNSTGLVQGNGPGETMIVARTVSGNHTASCLVVVTVPVSSVSISPQNLSLRPGESSTLQATVSPSDASNKSLIWQSTDSQVATVSSSGQVTGTNSGNTTITVTTVDGNYSDTSTVVVSDIAVTGLEISPKSITIIRSEEYPMTATVTPEDASNKEVRWISVTPSVASVNPSTGVVTGLAEGVTIITAITVDGGYQDSSTITVRVPVVGITLDSSSFTLDRPETRTLVHNITPADATNQSVFWSSSSPDVATVDQEGLVTPVKTGTSTISVSTVDGDYSAEAVVTVYVPLLGLELNPPSATVRPEETLALTPVFDPSDASNQTVGYSTSNPNVALVDSAGVVTGVASGEATITVVSYNAEYVAFSEILVPIPAASVSLNTNSIKLGVGRSRTLEATVEPPEATFKEVIWSSDDETIATVDADGMVTGQGVGETSITATTVDGGFTASATATVVLYDFTFHNFTTCGESGRTGPSQINCISDYSIDWAEDPAFFSVDTGIQIWTVPETGTYRVDVYGAQGGFGRVGFSGYEGGRGARIRGDFHLEAGEQIRILVGQQGSTGNRGGGGGGGSYVVRMTDQAILVAGGGGGGSYSNNSNNKNAVTAPNGQQGGSGGAGGTGGGNSDQGRRNGRYWASGGGGFNTNGEDSNTAGNGGRSFRNGGSGGTGFSTEAGSGGFGGGAGASGYSSTTYWTGGGGGGWAGGGGGGSSNVGGGAGSLTGGGNPVNQPGVRTGDGIVTISRIN